ncbi:MurR/RpiR family transcriptional regulator [Ahrensia marina]|uniref:MurR/RpiR family transcriptional regulator n=1 Tax=Ahrensia marina TaxID=1514904 RepID=UPI0035CF8AEE
MNSDAHHELATTEVDDNLLEVITRGLPNLRKSERRVAETLLADPSSVLSITLAELARRSDVSEPTVIRFALAIGCEGFRDLRVKLARSLAFARTTSHSAISKTDDLSALIGKVFDFNLSNLNWVRARLDQQTIQQAVDALRQANRIEFFGYGASGVVALDAQQKFPLFGVPCGAPLDGHQMIMTAAMLQPGDVAVAISNTGETEQVRQATRLARERGATTIGITGTQSPLLEDCDIGVLVETLENTDLYTPTVSRLSAMVVIDILSTAVSLARDESDQTRFAEMKAVLARTRASNRDTEDE